MFDLVARSSSSSLAVSPVRHLSITLPGVTVIFSI